MRDALLVEPAAGPGRATGQLAALPSRPDPVNFSNTGASWVMVPSSTLSR